MLLLVGESGYRRVTVQAVCARAGVSRETFYRSFMGLQDCFLALVDGLRGQVVEIIESAFDREGDWRAGSRTALLELLPLFDEPKEAAVELPPMLSDPRARRARQCLSYLAAKPGASNRQVAQGVQIAWAEQVSRLLARLHALGLLEKRAGLPGRPNAWALSAEGARIAALLDEREPATVTLSSFES